jgi:hypothetical protein
MTDMPPTTLDGQPPSVVPIPVQYPMPGSAAVPVPSPGRVAAEMHVAWRVTSALVGAATLVFAAVLAWHEDTEGVASAAAFGVAFFALIFAFAGVVPASVKVGDIEVKVQQAKEDGKEEGKKAGKEEGWKEGAEATGLDAFIAGCEVAQKVSTGDLDLDTIKTEVAAALSSEMSIDLPDMDKKVPVPNLDSASANARAGEIVDVLAPVAP